MKKPKIKNFALILFFLALASAIIWGMPFDRPFQNNEQAVRESVAMFILENGLFVNNNLMHHQIDKVFYPVFTAGVFKIFGPYPAVLKVINIFIFIGLVLLVYKLCQMVFDEKLARLAGFITAICYTLASYTSWFSREIFFVAAVFLLVYFLYQAQIKKSTIWFIVAGLTFGLAFLTNAVIQYFLPIIVVNFLILERKEGLKKIILNLVVFIFAFSLFVSPWFIADYLHFGQTPFFSKQGFLFDIKLEKMEAIKGKYIQHLVANTTGDFFAQKLFPDYDRSEARFGWDSRDRWVELIAQEGSDIKGIDYKLTKNSLIEFIKHPILFLQMSSLDFLKFNTPMVPDVRMQHMFTESDSHPELSDLTKGTIILFIRFIYLIFAILIIYAMVKNIRNWPKMSWLVLIVIYFNLVFSNVHAIARYSLPVYPFYIILLALGLLIFWDKILWKNKSIF